MLITQTIIKILRCHFCNWMGQKRLVVTCVNFIPFDGLANYHLVARLLYFLYYTQANYRWGSEA